MTALGMLLSEFFYLSGNLLFFFYRVLGAGWQFGVHAVHDFDEPLPRFCSVNHGLGFEHNGLAVDGCL
jgi:hypothetical protein